MTINRAASSGIDDQAPVKKPTSLRVVVVDNSRQTRPVNIRVPIGMVRWGMKMARGFSPEMKDANVDWDSISAMIEDGAQGEIVHVEDEAQHKTVEVWVE